LLKRTPKSEDFGFLSLLPMIGEIGLRVKKTATGFAHGRLDFVQDQQKSHERVRRGWCLREISRNLPGSRRTARIDSNSTAKTGDRALRFRVDIEDCHERAPPFL
jgi:hypothetical protein